MFLSSLPSRYRHALLMFDFDGCGQEQRYSREEIQQRLKREFAATDSNGNRRGEVCGES